MKVGFTMINYTGPLNIKKMPKKAQVAYRSWCNQRQRCLNTLHPHYKYYGAKGFSVLYSSRQFINWWLKELRDRPRKGVVVCERIDHDKGYFFGNIKLGSPRSNTLECADRGVWCKKIILVSKSGKVLRRFKSIKDAAKFARRASSNIVNVCKGRYAHTNGLVFRYEA